MKKSCILFLSFLLGTAGTAAFQTQEAAAYEAALDSVAQTEEPAPAEGPTEISAYFQMYTSLVDALGMTSSDDWQYLGAGFVTYRAGDFMLAWNQGNGKSMFSMENNGSNQVSLYGIYTGDSILNLDDRLLGSGWVSGYKTEGCWYYYSWQNGDTFYLEARFDDAEAVTSWYLCNWPQGDGYSTIYDQLLSGAWTEPVGAAAIVPDGTLRAYILQRYDANGDGYLSEEERNAVTEILVDKYHDISSMKGIEYFPNLEKLMCDENMIRELDVRFNPNLRILTFNSNRVSQIDLTQNTKLTELYCSDNQLTQLDVSRNPELIALVCDYNQLTGLNTQNNLKLQILEYGHNLF